MHNGINMLREKVRRICLDLAPSGAASGSHPSEDLSNNIVNAGAVNVIYGQNNSGLVGGLSATATPDQFWTQAYLVPPILQP